MVLGPVDSARSEAQAQLETLHRQLHAGSLILDGLPAFLGADGPRHYVFGASNPAELRGTGGLIGAYAILTMDRGRFSFSDFRPIQSLPRPDVSDGSVSLSGVLGQLGLLPVGSGTCGSTRT